MRTFPIAALVLALGATPSLLPAQPGRGWSRADRGAIAGRGGAERGGVVPAEALLRQRERLVLSDDQVKRLEALAQAQRTARPASPGQALRLRADLLDAMAGDGNPQAARAVLDRISAQRNEQIVLAMRARQEARAVLTPEQRARADAMRQRAARQFAARPSAGRARGAGMRPGAVGRGDGRPGARGHRPGQAGPRGVVPRGSVPRRPAPPADGVTDAT